MTDYSEDFPTKICRFFLHLTDCQPRLYDTVILRIKTLAVGSQEKVCILYLFQGYLYIIEYNFVYFACFYQLYIFIILLQKGYITREFCAMSLKDKTIYLVLYIWKSYKKSIYDYSSWLTIHIGSLREKSSFKTHKSAP